MPTETIGLGHNIHPNPPPVVQLTRNKPPHRVPPAAGAVRSRCPPGGTLTRTNVPLQPLASGRVQYLAPRQSDASGAQDRGSMALRRTPTAL